MVFEDLSGAFVDYLILLQLDFEFIVVIDEDESTLCISVVTLI